MVNIEPIPFAGLVEVPDTDDKRFCAYCQCNKPSVSFKMVTLKSGAKRWKCATCRARSSIPKYRSKSDD
jgi:LSD1 subclass zinc finger protein